MLTFQEMISTLIHYWAHQGCIIHQPHDIETGAGTFNPATFLRVLGPEPYSCVYVEPSKRPQDGRYGDNPNRTQLFHQLQVIIKPSLDNIQELYLQSLELIGFDLKNHDIRFVHDDWESPTLGAWGLGWEVWIDGMEITQFTYFQSVAGHALNPISVEITYGLERLAMLLQQKVSFFDMQYNEKMTYGDVFHRNEVEFSTYNFEKASVEMWERHFNDFEQEATNLIAAQLPIPAYDFVIKASHAFNMLEARGAISTTERMRLILRIRTLAYQVADLYIESREKQGFPLLKYTKPLPSSEEPSLPNLIDFDPNDVDDLLLEIGSEPLPATYIEYGATMLKQKMEALLKKHQLTYKEIETYSTPQRLAIKVKGLVCGIKEETLTRKGPPLHTAFDENGELLEQGKGFFNALGLKAINRFDIDKEPTLSIETIKGIDYLFVTQRKPKRSTLHILQSSLPEMIEKMTFEKNMRWGSYESTYARPIRWILALFGNDLIPFKLAHIVSGTYTFGHAQLCFKKSTLSHPDAYLKTLRSMYVLASQEERKQSILQQLQDIEKETKTRAVHLNRVLQEVVNLTEWPQLTYTSFDDKFLIAPKELLVSEMIEHQRYFPLENTKGELKNIFVITADNRVNDLIRENNQKVLSARLSDGVFLYEFDLQTQLEDFNNKLKKVTFQKDLGSIYDKVLRVKKSALLLAEKLKIGDPGQIVRAATLCKADLASELTQEFPELQGTIGKHYALVQGEEKEVALAIEDHWLPNSENGPLPQTTTGTLLSLADKFDNLLGYFSVGLKPSSSSDPFALRRQTLGILKIILAHQWSFNIKTFLNDAYHFIHPSSSGEEIIKEILQFCKNRMKTILQDHGIDKDVIDAALMSEFTNPYKDYCKAKALQIFKRSAAFPQLLEVYKRAKGQIENQPRMQLEVKALKTSSEVSLHQALQLMESSFQEAFEQGDFTHCFDLLSKLQKPLAHLFDEVKILSDQPIERQNRIAMLQNVFEYFSYVLDFSKIQF